MSLKRLYIFCVGLLAIVSIALLYLVVKDIFSQSGKVTGMQTIETKNENTGALQSLSHQCIQNFNEVKIHAYMFHYIIPDKYVNKDNTIEYGNSISPEKLETILQTLSGSRASGKIEVVSLSDLAEFKKTDCFPNKNIVLLTVDDGWDDGYNFLFPLAKKYDMKFNLAIIASKVSVTTSEMSNFLNEHEIQEMLDSRLITLASHSFSHIELVNQTEEVLKKELSLSKETLENLFHITINTVVYPSGKHDAFTVQKAKEYGYTFGFTTKKGIINKEDLNKNPLALPRIRVNRETDIAKTFLFE